MQPWGDEAGIHYRRLRATLKRQDTIIGNNDLLIAAQARSLSAVLSINDTHEFTHIPDLTLEDWI